MVLIIAACSSSDDPVSPASTAPPPAPTTTTAAPTTTSGVAQSLTDEEALAVSDAYIDAFNSGDADAVLAMFTDDVALSEKYTGMSDSFEAIDRAIFEQHLAWSTAQGTTFTSPECAVTEDGAGAAVTVSCELGWLDAAEKAVDAPPVPTVLTMVVTPDGISQLASEYVPEFGLDSFERWVGVNHRDNSAFVGFGGWDSVAEAEQSGILLAQYVAEWVAFLEANDCTYEGTCT
jgi:ketosteroid isomerase-like protein